MKKHTDSPTRTPQKSGHARRIIPIRRRIWGRIAIRWLILLAIAAVFVILCAVSAPTYRSNRNMQIGWGMTAAIYAVIVWQSHAIERTFTKEWTGKIVGREVVKYTKFGKGPLSARRPVMATKCIWTVEQDDGYLEKVSYDTDEIWERYFNVGDRVRLYKNAKIIVKANPAPDDENLMCPLCGAMVCRPVCLFCGVDFTEAPPSLSAENPSAE